MNFQITGEAAAILISSLSLAIAILALGWNVYRDVLLKPTLVVKIDVIVAVVPLRDRAQEVTEAMTSVSAVNHGPGPITCQMITARSGGWWRRLFRREQHAVVMPDYENPLSARLPLRLEVGETGTWLMPYERDGVLHHGPDRVGVNDSFGRTHWVDEKRLRALVKQSRERFGPYVAQPDGADQQDTTHAV